MSLTVDLEPSGKALKVAFPNGSTVVVPATEGGMRALVAMLEQALFIRHKRDAPQLPTQAVLDAWLKENRPRKVAEDGKEYLSLDDLGLGEAS